jgi:hypothetical protein
MNNGGPSETLVDGETGYLVPPKNSDALADRVVGLAARSGAPCAHGAGRARRVLEHFTAAGYAANFHNYRKSDIAVTGHLGGSNGSIAYFALPTFPALSGDRRSHSPREFSTRLHRIDLLAFYQAPEDVAEVRVMRTAFW